MLVRCLFLLLLGIIIAAKDYSRSWSSSCTLPVLKHGRVVVRGSRGKLIKFICDRRYELAGNKYATCRGKDWDVPIPVCIRPGCVPPIFDNGIQIPSNDGAWITHFCLPGYRLVGSSVIYCDGRQWNDTAPRCVDSSEQSALSCDFEDPDLCGWTQDEMHDFDWTRLNRKTPSSFLLTGPSYDHTFGNGGSGYYMYIESTSRLKNDSARFISPIYNQALSDDGCFSFFYHMFGKTIGGLRVYQKPDNLPMAVLLNLEGSRRDAYLLFEKWGNQGDQWFNSVADLKNLGDNFQIIIEGIRGASFTSDIAIDDVAVLQGENCTAAKNSITTPSTIYMPESCLGRCMRSSTVCGCSYTCIYEQDCCPDFIDVCAFNPDTTTTDEDLTSANSSHKMPQTQKLVSTTPETTSSSTTTTSTTTTSTTTTTTTHKPTTTSTTTRRTTTTPRPIPTTTPKPTTTTTTTRTRKPTTTIRRPTTTAPTQPVPAKPSTRKITPSTKMSTRTTITTSTTTSTPAIRPSTSAVQITTILDYGISRTIENHNQYHDMIEKAKKELDIEVRKLHDIKNEQNKTSGWKILFIILGSLICIASVSWIVVVSRSSRGRLAIARFRGRCSQDPEVRYLSTDVDDD